MYEYYHEVRYVLFGLTNVTLRGREYSTLSQKLVVIYNIKKTSNRGLPTTEPYTRRDGQGISSKDRSKMELYTVIQSKTT